MRICSLLIALLLTSAPAALAADKSIRLTEFYKVEGKHKSFIQDFNALMKKHPDAARQFGLVDTGIEQPIAKVIVWKCEDFGGALDPPECRPEPLE